MRAIILAAGLGSRLGNRSKGLPKALVRVGDRTIIENQLEALSSEGVGPITVVIGHGRDRIREVLGDSVEYVINDRPGETNSLYSLWLARECLEGDVLLLNSDVIFHPRILKALLAAKGSALAYDSVAAHGAEQTKIGLHRGRVTDLGKDLPTTGARGENLGLIKLDADGAAALRRRAEAIVDAGEEKAWVTEAVRSILAEVDVEGVNVAGLPWVEIDFPYDLDRARRQVWPAIERDTHPGRVLWRRARVPALVSIPLVLSAAAWSLSAQMGPASIDWETVAPREGSRVKVRKVESGGSQSWWLLRPGETLTLDTEGELPTRLEARPVLEGPQDTASFVIQVTVDGEPFRYESKRSRPDPRVALEDGTLGKRYRKKYTLPAGRHTVGVTFLAGTSAAVLVRVRQPE